MEWKKTHSSYFPNNGVRKGVGIMYVKVMTDEQMEVLRRQIAVYATICEQLVEMHKIFSSQQDSTSAGMRFGNMYCDTMMTSSTHKIGARQRWTPTPIQLQILENIFKQGNGTPSKQKIKDVTLELTKHGQISETNVYNWFQNRRARSKRKHPSSARSNTESETEVEIESPDDKKAKAGATISQEVPLSSRVVGPFQYQQKNSEVHLLNPDANRLLDYSGANSLMGKMYYTGMDQLMGKMDSNWEL